MAGTCPQAEAASLPAHSSSTGVLEVCTSKIQSELRAKTPGARQAHCSAGQDEELGGSACPVPLPHVTAASDVPLPDASL